jgi:hypothetical protein
VLAVATAVGAGILFLLLRSALVDDAYITLSYGRTLGLHGEWGLVPGYESNTATSSLNVLLLGSLIAVVREPLVALGILYVTTCVLTALGLRALGRELGLGLRLAVIGVPLLVASPLLASSLGLETTMVVAAVTWLAWAAARGHAVWFGIVAGICMWLRLDTRGGRRRALPAHASAVAPLVPGSAPCCGRPPALAAVQLDRAGVGDP